MPQDAFTLRYLCNELNVVFAGGKINRIVQPNNDEVVFTVYTGKCTKKLSLCVNPASPRIGIVAEEKDCPLTAPNFCMLLRKHLLSATIDKISLVGFDRIVKIDLTPSREFFDDPQKTLYVELMGRYSNVILTENGKILGGNRGINVFDDGVRPLFVGKNYVFPPVGDKKVPADRSLIEYYDACSGEGIANYICSGVQGVAISTAKEIERVFLETHGDNLENFGEKLYKVSNDFLYDVKLSPCVIIDKGVVKDVCVYPYKCIDGQIKSFNSLWEAEQFFFSEKEKSKLFIAKLERAKSLVSTQVKKLKKKLTAITAKEKEASSAENNRIFGELILSNIYNIKQGQSSCTCYDYYNDVSVEIPLDTRLSPSKNAEIYFKKYNKLKRTLIAIEPQKEWVLQEVAYFDSVLDELGLCESIEDVSQIYLELEQVGIIKTQNSNNRKQDKSKSYREYEVFGFTVLVGRNNAENDRLTFTSKPEDVWLHVKDYHSSHVIIKTEGKEVAEEVIVKAASICAYYSKCRESGKAEVVYALKKHVKKPPKSKLGFCTYDNFKSISVAPDKCVEFLKSE